KQGPNQANANMRAVKDPRWPRRCPCERRRQRYRRRPCLRVRQDPGWPSKGSGNGPVRSLAVRYLLQSPGRAVHGLPAIQPEGSVRHRLQKGAWPVGFPWGVSIYFVEAGIFGEIGWSLVFIRLFVGKLSGIGAPYLESPLCGAIAAGMF